jgi:predicted DNA-binding transcriptional regulator AlpA
MLAEIAQRSGMSVKQIYNLSRAGELPGTKDLLLKPGQSAFPLLETLELVAWMEVTFKAKEARAKNAELRKGKRPARAALSKVAAVKYHVREVLVALADMKRMGTLDRDMPLELGELEDSLGYIFHTHVELRNRRLAREQDERKGRMAKAGVAPRS